MTDNPYETLGVDKDSSPEDIKKAYRDKAKEAHPDHGGDEDKMTALSVAYAILCDPKKKGQYDRTGQVKDGLKLHKEAVDYLCNCFQMMLNTFGDSAIYENLIDHMEQQMKNDIKAEEGKIVNAMAMAEKWRKMAKRFSRKNPDTPPIFEQMIGNSARSEDAISDNAKDSIKIVEEALRIIKEYEFTPKISFMVPNDYGYKTEGSILGGAWSPAGVIS